MAQQNQQMVQQAQPQPVPSLEKRVATLSSKTTQWLTNNIMNPNLALSVPKGYNVGNEVSAMIFAISQIQDMSKKSALDVCSEDQVMNEVKDAVIQGLSISKKHVYPIIYGGKLSLQRSYFGTIAALSYMFPDYLVVANVLYEGDTYDYCTDEIAGYNYITNVHSSLANRDGEIIGAYAVIYDKNTKERIYGCVMTMKEIQANWNKSKSKDRTTQKEFPQEMAKRTVINRCCKMFVNSGSNTNTEFVGAFNRMTEGEYIDVTPDRTDETDKQRMLKSKSEGSKGLKSMLDAEKKAATDVRETPVSEAITAEGEIIQETRENAPATQEEAPLSKVGRAPSVRVDEWGNVVPNDAPSEAADEYGDNLPF